MPDNTYTFVIAPVLGCFTVISLVVIGYLTSLEFADRRRKRRMEEKLGQLESSRRYRKPSHYLSTQKSPVHLTTSTARLNLGQAFQNTDRFSGWNFTSNNLN
jgi:hypothetical protein